MGILGGGGEPAQDFGRLFVELLSEGQGGMGMYGLRVIAILGVEVHCVGICCIMEDVGHAIVRGAVRIAGMQWIHQTMCGRAIANRMGEMKEGDEMK